MFAQHLANHKVSLTVPLARAECPWWSQELAALRRASNEARTRLRRQPNAVTRSAALAAYLTYKDKRDEANRTSFEEFLSSIPAHNPFAALKKFYRPSPTTCLTGSGPDAATTALESFLCHPLTTVDTQVPRPFGPLQLATVPLDEVREIVRKAKKTGAGPDNIPWVYFKDNPAAVLDLHATTEASFAAAVFPEVWKRGRIVPIPKKGGSLRPITMLPVAGKVLEKVIKARLTDAVDGLLHDGQHAYRSGRSTESAIGALVNFAKSALTAKRSCIIIAFDLSKAFDRLNRAAVIDQLISWNVDTRLISMIASFLSSRSVSLCIGPSKATSASEMGCPQGSVLGPLLWLIQANSLLEALSQACSSHDSLIIGYADDIYAAIDVADPWRYGTPFIREATVAAKEWAAPLGHALNASKTQAAIFSRSRNLPASVGGIPYSNPLRVLGIPLDRRLTMRAYVEERVSGARAIGVRFTGLARQKWPLAPHIGLRIYNAVTLPYLLYGIRPLAATGLLGRQHYEKSTDSVARAAAIGISGAGAGAANRDIFRIAGTVRPVERALTLTNGFAPDGMTLPLEASDTQRELFGGNFADLFDHALIASNLSTSRVAVRLLTGTAITPARLCTFRLRPNPRCFCGGAVGDTLHAVTRCRRPTAPKIRPPITFDNFEDAAARLDEYLKLFELER